MQTELQLTTYNFNDGDRMSNVRTIEFNGEIWFVGVDVTRTLGYKNGRDAIARHCKPKGVAKHDTLTSKGWQNLTLISEGNVMRLIMKSQLPSAEAFEEWVFDEVLPAIRKKGYYGRIDRAQLPNFILRYRDNYHKIPSNYFSVISELFVRLYMALEAVGYNIPDRGVSDKAMMPDISVGRGFSKYLKDLGSEHVDNRRTYKHQFPEKHRPDVDAYMYHIDALPAFIQYVHDVWIPQNASKYFKDRDPKALEHLPKLLK